MVDRIVNTPELPDADSARLPFVSVEARRATLSLLDSVGAFESDPSGAWNFVNPALCEMLGVPASSLLGREWIKMIHPDEVHRTVAEYKQARDSGRSWHHTVRFRRYDGFEVRVRIHANPLPKTAEGPGVSYLGIVGDITEQVRAQKLFNESADAMQVLMDAASEGMWVHRNGRVLVLNNRAAEMLGYDSPDQLVGVDAFQFVAPEDYEKFAAAVRGEGASITVGKLIRKDGSVFTALVRGLPTIYGGAPARVAAFMDTSSPQFLDIENRRLKAAFDALEQHLTLPHNRLALRDGRIRVVAANQAYADLVGRPLEEVIGIDVAELAPPEINAEQWGTFDAMRREGKRWPTIHSLTYRRPDGTLVRGRVHAVDYTDPVTGEFASMSFIVPL